MPVGYRFRPINGRPKGYSRKRAVIVNKVLPPEFREYMFYLLPERWDLGGSPGQKNGLYLVFFQPNFSAF
jgi:hypothetical protein